jgi:archaellum component FlaC
MVRGKIFDDLAGIANGMAGLTNDALHHARGKVDCLQKTFQSADELESLKKRIKELEAKVEVLEKNAPIKGGKNDSA